MVRLLGPSAASEMFFTARQYTADEALRIGLVNQVVPRAELAAYAARYVHQIAANAPLTLRAAKRAIIEVQRDPAKRDAAAVARRIAACFESEDYAEGVRAFLEKRPPDVASRAASSPSSATAAARTSCRRPPWSPVAACRSSWCSTAPAGRTSSSSARTPASRSGGTRSSSSSAPSTRRGT
jgi:hypothetical protein